MFGMMPRLISPKPSRLPQDARLKNDWLNLLKSIGSEDLAQEPLVGPVIPLEANRE
jgi:hypothetical protein